MAECVDSIINQTYKNLEIILVDDGSPDNCGKMCDEYAQKDSRIVVIHKPNGGLSDARNAGLDIAKGEFVSFIDSDDFIIPEAIERLYGTAVEDGSDLVCGGRYDLYGDVKFVSICPRSHDVLTAEQIMAKIMTVDECDVSFCDKMYRLSLFEGVRFPLGEINEDAATFYKVVSRVGKASTLPLPIYYYRQRAQSITSNFSEKKLIYIDHANDIVAFVKENYPNILDVAEGYYNKQLIDILISISLSARPERKKYRRLYREKIKELSKRKKYVCEKDKLKYLTLKTRTFRILKTVKFKLRMLRA